MNKETIDYTSEEFWATAPKDATHWEPESEDWRGSWIRACDTGNYYYMASDDRWYEEFRQEECDCDYEELCKTFIPRSITFTKPVQENFVGKSDWFVDGKCVEFPPVGEVVEILWSSETECLPASYEKIRIIAVDGDDIIYRCFVNDSIGNLSKAVLHSDEHPMFRPIKKEVTIQEKILEAWKAQGIDFAYDNKDTTFSFKVLVDFVVNNFDVKGKD